MITETVERKLNGQEKTVEGQSVVSIRILEHLIFFNDDSILGNTNQLNKEFIQDHQNESAGYQISRGINILLLLLCELGKRVRISETLRKIWLNYARLIHQTNEDQDAG